ncbi:MAG: PQQ-binding-like beta-propeller repeat protein [Candidatus Methanospirare jalkutatii]|nr:MAG: PQQ-binding-like beta-propeller repeat protein [Candidatus Methanospirare jalkutatii]UYZ40710.1 MAG: PQQ-binding-like beta-propeller repeat protein [Candidatus Methanospirare jalkutatii]
MNKRKILGVLFALVICMVSVAHMIAQPTPPTPFMIDGYVYDATGNPCNGASVQITNLNTGESWYATTVSASNRYQLVLSSENVSAGDILEIEVSGCNQSRTVEHEVTQNEINAGGFTMNITLALPDLVLTEKSEELHADGTFSVTYTVCNQGAADAGESNTTITINGVEVLKDPVPALPAGESYTNTVGPFECPCGTNVTVKVCADSDDEIVESNETNNCLENVLECPPCKKPDLTITELTTPEIYANIDNTINATVSNIGEGDADAFNVSLLADGSVVDTVSVAGLKANESVNLSFTWTPTHAGEYELCVIADSNDEIEESDETNNEYCETVTVLESKPDLVIVRIALKTPGYVNEENVLGVLVKNIGVSDAGSFEVSLSVDGTLLGEQTVASLAAGESTELEYAWTPTELRGHVLSATVDTKNEVEEYNETNNDYTRTSVIIKRTDWSQFHYDEKHLGFSPSEAPNTNKTLWVSDDISAIGSTSPAVADGKVFVYSGPTGWSGGENAQLYCFDAFTGNILWNVSIPTPEWGSWSSPAYHDGKVFTATGKETRCINASTGELIWKFVNPTGEASCNGGPVIADGKVITNDWQGRHYYCLDEETGELLWTFTETNTGSWGTAYAQGTPAYADGKFYLTTWVYTGGHVYCVDADTGEVIWHRALPLDTCGSPTVSNGIVYVTTYNFYGDGDIYALNATDGSILWHHKIQRTDSTPAVAYGNVYVAGGCPGFSDIQTYCFNATTGELLWATNVSEGIGGWTQSVAVADGKVFVGKPSSDFFGYAGTYALDAFTGEIIWSYPEGGSSPAVADGIVFTIGGGRVYAFAYIESYGASVYYEKHVILARSALGEPDRIGAILFRDAEIAIELERTIPVCRNVSVWVRKMGFFPVNFSVYVSSDGENWTAVGNETCNSWRWTRFDFHGNWGSVKYIKIAKPGTWLEPRIMALDAVHAEN